MTQEISLEEKIKVMQHFSTGGKVESKRKSEEEERWEDNTLPRWNWDYMHYRIKPKTTYRYFNIYNGDDKWGFVHYSVDDARCRICREGYIHTLKVGSDGSIEILVL